MQLEYFTDTLEEIKSKIEREPYLNVLGVEDNSILFEVQITHSVSADITLNFNEDGFEPYIFHGGSYHIDWNEVKDELFNWIPKAQPENVALELDNDYIEINLLNQSNSFKKFVFPEPHWVSGIDIYDRTIIAETQKDLDTMLEIISFASWFD